jgi:hypothetical protein
VTKPAPTAPARKRGKDRWGWRPVRAGYVRGQIRNLRREAEVSPFGDLRVVEFDLFVDDDLPMIPVRMAGTDFSNDFREGPVVDVRDPDPSVRPIIATRLDFPPHFDHEIISYYPGRDDPPPAVGRLRAALMVLVPAGFVAAMLGLYYVFGR